MTTILLLVDDQSVDNPIEGDSSWDAWTPEEVARRFKKVATRWYVVAGWAIDLFHGEQTRSHDDIEIGTPAAGFADIRSVLIDFDCEVVGSIADGGQGHRWPLDSPAFNEHFQTWFREPHAGPYRLDVFRDPHNNDVWVCRRDTSIRRPYADIIRMTGAGIRYMSPEIVLLFKAKYMRERDRMDFALVVPALSDEQIAWLRHALEHVHPEHPWILQLR